MLCVKEAALRAGLCVPAFERIDARVGISNRKVIYHLEQAGWSIPTGQTIVFVHRPCIVCIQGLSPGGSPRAHVEFFESMHAIPQSWDSVIAWVAFPPPSGKVTP